MKKQKNVQIIVYILAGIFIMLAGYFTVPESVKQAAFPFMAVLLIVFSLLGIMLICLTLKLKVKRALKKFLILTGISAAGFLICIILHNFYYGMAIITGSYLMEIYHVAFFIIAIPICPICFLIGAVGSIILFKK